MTPPLATISLQPGSATARRGEPITVGIGLPPGRLHEVTRLVAVDAAAALPTAAIVLERWPDGSVRWALLDIRADVGVGGTMLAVRDDVAAAPIVAPLTIATHGHRTTITSGRFTIAVDLEAPSLLTAVSLAGAAVLDASATGVDIRDVAGGVVPLRFTTLDVEHATPLRVVGRIAGEGRTSDGREIGVRVRFTVLAGLAGLGVEIGLHNPAAATHPGGFWELGDPGSIRLHSLTFDLAVPAPVSSCRLSIDTGAPFESYAVPLALTQHASGGEHWMSRVHVNHAGEVRHAHRGFTLDAAGASTTGLRASPIVVAAHAGGLLAVGARRFWQVFPKAVVVDPGGRVSVACLPAGPDLHELQGGERSTHECWVAFAEDAICDASFEWRRSPSTALPDAASVAAAEQLPALAHPIDPTRLYEQLVAAAIDGDDTFLVKRERIDEYGWRHFGDLYADHENGDVPGRQLVSHYNNQYDALLGLQLQALRHSDHRWWHQAHDLARHLVQTDIYWTTRDRAAINGGSFWHTGHYVDAGTSTHRTYPRNSGLLGGGPSNEHCYTQGLLLHHCLTGDASSRDAVLTLARWIQALDDGRQARWPLPWLSRGPTGGASFTNTPDHHGPGRGAANAVVAQLNGFRLSGDERFLAMADELVRRVIHPLDDIDARQLLDAERRWSYTVFLQALGRYLATREALGRRDDMWDYARASLLHYARWMAAHEYLYLEKPEILEFPTETWPAQDVRKAEVFDLAALHAATPGDRALFLERARDFHTRALTSLAGMATRTRTRPLVLLLTNGYTRAWHETAVPAAPLSPAPPASWAPPVRFVPQKAVALRRLIWLAAAGVAALVGLVTAFVLR